MNFYIYTYIYIIDAKANFGQTPPSICVMHLDILPTIGGTYSLSLAASKILMDFYEEL